ncbi:hypothetical protein NDU88_003193 [Pleurodeles waltl]|uniref:Uncharacterized protein n=1 Tax=Pleurodeles waltl TaxID=8319 RepID=A0AAV7WNQ2_PLEWA|nr:hypothetical protein NDU88_003193 [Pleurodeles waltl]
MWSSGSRPGAQGPGGAAASHPRPMGLSSEPGCPESKPSSSFPRVQPAPYTDRLGTLGPFRDGLLGQPQLLFQAKSFHQARDRPTRGPAVSQRPFLAERRPSSPPVCAPSSGPTRVKWGRVAPGPGKPPPPRRSGHPSAVACLFHPAHFPQQVRTTVPWGVPAGPGWQAPLRPMLRLHFGPAVSLPRRQPVPAGSRATALSSPSGGVRRTVRDRHAATPSPQQVRLPG